MGGRDFVEVHCSYFKKGCLQGGFWKSTWAQLSFSYKQNLVQVSRPGLSCFKRATKFLIVWSACEPFDWGSPVKQKPLLTEIMECTCLWSGQNKIKIGEWAIFKKGIFSDESTVFLYGFWCLWYVRRWRFEKCYPNGIPKSLNHPHDQMVWDAFPPKVYFTDGTINVNMYIEKSLAALWNGQQETNLPNMSFSNIMVQETN